MAWYNDLWNGMKKGVSDVAAVAAQVGSMTLNAGASALKGGATLLTDPGKFAKDVVNNIGEAGRHVSGGIQDGLDLIGEGWNEAVAAKNPGMFLWKALGGTAQMASLGTIHAFKEHIDSVSTVQRDELGNMTGFDIDKDADAITRLFLENNGQTMSMIVNANEEVREALAEGDAAKANKMFGHMVDATVVKPVGEAAKAAALGVAAGAAIVGTGGTAAPVVAATVAGLGIGGHLASGKGDKSAAEFDIANVDDDVSDRIDADIEALRAAGRDMSEADAARYRDVMQAYYNGAAYTGAGDSLGEAYMGEGASNQAFKDWMTDAAGLPQAPEEEPSLAAAVAGLNDAGGPPVQPAVASADAEASAEVKEEPAHGADDGMAYG